MRLLIFSLLQYLQPPDHNVMYAQDYDLPRNMFWVHAQVL